LVIAGPLIEAAFIYLLAIKGKKEMAIGRTDERRNPLMPVALTGRVVVWMSLADFVWGSGQRPVSKAGHMTAFEPTPVS
jgi:hypothetical protein